MSAVEFEGTNPILRVQDLRASLDYYTGVLGFTKQWGDSSVACVGRGRCHLFLCEGDQGKPGSWVWVGVSDADALLDEYQRTGAEIRHSPTNYEWVYEMQVEDPDGNVLRFGSEPEPGEPRGEWLDMRGERWAPLASGGWRRVEQS